MAKIIELIYTEERKGVGTKDNPIRLCTQLWTKEGLLVLEFDPMARKGGTSDPSEDEDWFGETEFNRNNL